jgi:hypothetical protein
MTTDGQIALIKECLFAHQAATVADHLAFTMPLEKTGTELKRHSVALPIHLPQIATGVVILLTLMITNDAPM